MDKVIITCLLISASFSIQARDQLIQLKKDPFKQPDILKYRPPATASTTENLNEDQEIPELKLMATLISVSEPMVLVNDTLLEIGEKIEGMKLILIDEGRAVFRFKGKNHEFTLEKEKTNGRR